MTEFWEKSFKEKQTMWGFTPSESAMAGVKIFFYDTESIKKDFQKYGLIEFSEIDEIDSDNKDKPPMKFLMIKCIKQEKLLHI